MLSHCYKEDFVLASTADFATALDVLQKYTSETRSMVDDFLETADWLTKFKINRDILANFHSAILRYRRTRESGECMVINSDLAEVKSVKEMKFEDVVNLPTLITMHEVRVLQIQMEHIMPILQNEKVVVPAVSSRVNIENKVLGNDENIKKIPSDQINASKIPADGIKEKNMEIADINRDDHVRAKEMKEKQEERCIFQDNGTNNLIADVKNDDHEHRKDCSEVEDKCANNVSEDFKNVGYTKVEAEEKRVIIDAVMKKIMKFVFDNDISTRQHIAELRQMDLGEHIEQYLSHTSIEHNITTIFIEDQTAGTIIHMADKISDTCAYYFRTPPFVIQNIPWHVFYSHDDDALGMFVGYDVESEIEDVTARVYLILVSQKPGVKNLVKEYTHTFSSENPDCGFSQMIDWNKLMDPATGYVKNDKIILQAIIQPQN